MPVDDVDDFEVLIADSHTVGYGKVGAISDCNDTTAFEFRPYAAKKFPPVENFSNFVLSARFSLNPDSLPFHAQKNARRCSISHVLDLALALPFTLFQFLGTALTVERLARF